MPDVIAPARKHLELLMRWVDSARATEDERALRVWGPMAESFNDLMQAHEQLLNASRPVPASYGDLSDLPSSLRSQLAGLRTDELDDQIYIIVKAAEEGADLDTILIELWRRFRVEQTRRFIQNKSYRLAQKGILFSVTGKKGLYTATEEDARRLSPTGAAPAALPAPTAQFDPADAAEEAEDDDLIG